VLGVAACGGSSDGVKQGEKLEDTGWFLDTADPSNCTHRVVTTEPDAGESGWYWLDEPRVFTETRNEESYGATLIDDQGVAVQTTVDWDADGLFYRVVTKDGFLQASTDYTLRVQDCLTTTDIPFSTSEFGAPLDEGPGSLVGATWHLDLINADWVEPGGLGALLALYFTTPVLIGVQYADLDTIDFIGAPGVIGPFGNVVQDLTESTWDFPSTGFDEAPFFDATTDAVTFEYEGSVVPVSDFEFSGTISGDMTAIGGGLLTGLADTRNLGSALGVPGNESAMCETAVSLGVSCIDCPDGEPYCLYIEVRSVDGELVDGLEIQK